MHNMYIMTSRELSHPLSDQASTLSTALSIDSHLLVVHYSTCVPLSKNPLLHLTSGSQEGPFRKFDETF